MARLTSSYGVGDRIWEGRGSDRYSAGRIVSVSESPSRPNRTYMLLRDDDGNYTIYTCLTNCECHPSVARRIPHDVLETLVEEGLNFELPPETARDSVPSPSAVVVKRREEPTGDLSSRVSRARGKILPEYDYPRLPPGL